MTTTQAKKCADLIEERMREREEEIRSLLADPESDDSYDPALSVDTEKITKICLSYGGPSDYLEVIHNEGEIKRVTYRYSDWFDTATREVREGDALWIYAEYIVEGMGE